MSRDTGERDAAEARQARAERRRVARREFENAQLSKLDAHMEEERRRWEREVELRNRDEDRSAPPGWIGEIVLGPDATSETRRAIEAE